MCDIPIEMGFDIAFVPEKRVLWILLAWTRWRPDRSKEHRDGEIMVSRGKLGVWEFFKG